MMTLTLVDDSLGSGEAVEVNIFGSAPKLPPVRQVGDICRLHRAKVSQPVWPAACVYRVARTEVPRAESLPLTCVCTSFVCRRPAGGALGGARPVPGHAEQGSRIRPLLGCRGA